MKNDTIINIEEIQDIYRESCKINHQKYKRRDFQQFLNFLEIDFYDWVRENLKQYSYKKSKN